MAKAVTDKTKAAKVSTGVGQPKGTAAVLGRYLARNRDLTGQMSAAVVLPKPTPERAVSTAIGRAAQKCCALPSFPVQSAISRATLAELIELLPDRALILVVENHLGIHGIVALSPGFLSAMIEMQSMGRVFTHAPPDRRPTRTDASICAEFVNVALAELASELGVLGAAGPLAVFRFASFVDDPKPLELMLDDTIYDSFRLETRLGQGGARAGCFLAFLPGREVDQTAPTIEDSAAPAGSALRKATRRNLSDAVRAAPITLNAVLCRKKISLRDLRGLVPGATIALPFDAMGKTRLETQSGMVVVTGKLGALHGNRAIRIAGCGTRQTAPPGPPGAEMATWDKAAVSAPGAASMDSSENVFAGENDDLAEPRAPLFASEPPLGDLADPDLFRSDNDGAEDGPEQPLGLPMNFMIE